MQPLAPLSWTIGTRYARSKLGALSFVLRTAVLGLVLSVAVLMTVQSVLSGFEREIRERILRILPHVRLVTNYSSLDLDKVAEVASRVAGVETWEPTAEVTILMSSGKSVASAQLIGINPSTYDSVSKVGLYEQSRSLSGLQPGSFELAIGDQLARRLQLQLGDTVTVILPRPNITALGPLPRQKSFKIVGIIDTESILDTVYAYTHIDDARRLLRLEGEANTVNFRIYEPFDAPSIGLILDLSYGDEAVFSLNWTDSFGTLHSFIGALKNVFFLLFSLLVAVASFNLVSALVILVYERRADVAVLRTLGGSKSLVITAFLVTAGIIALVGVVLGGVGGLLLGYFLEWITPWLKSAFGMTFLSESFFIQTLTVEVNIPDLLKVAALASTLAMLGALFPAWRATTVQPADILRHE